MAGASIGAPKRKKMVASNLRLYILAGIYSKVEDNQHEDGRDQVHAGRTDVLERRRDDRTDRFGEAAKNGMELAC